MSENINIKFTTDDKALVGLIDRLEALGAIDKKLVDQFRQTTLELGKVSSSMNVLSTETKEAATDVKKLGDASKDGGITQLAKSMDSTVEKSKSLKQQLRELKQQLVDLESQGKGNTKEFNNLAKAAAKVQDDIGDLNQRVKNLASDTRVFDGLIQGVSGIAAGFSIAQGAAALLGSENEDLQKTLLKVQGSLAVLNGLQEVQNLLQKESAFRIAAVGFATRVVDGIMKVFTVSSAAAWAIATAGVTLLLAGVVALVAYLGDSNEEIVDLEANATRLADKQAFNNQKILDQQQQKVELAKINGKSTTEVYNLEKDLLDLKIEQTKQAAEKARLDQATPEGAKKFLDLTQQTIQLENEKSRLSAQYNVQVKSEFEEQSKLKKQKEKEDKESLEALLKEANDLTDVTIQENIRLSEESIRIKINNINAELAITEKGSKQELQLKLQLIEQQRLLDLEQANNSISNKELLQSQINLIDANAQEAKKAIIKENENLEKQSLDSLLAYANDISDQGEKDRQDKEEKRQEERKRQIELALQYIDTLSAIGSAVFDIQDERLDKQADKISKQRDLELKAAGDNALAKEAAEERYQKRLDKLNREKAVKDKKQAIFEATLALSGAVLKALNTTPPANVFLAATTAAIAGLRLAKLIATPIPAFAKGTKYLSSSTAEKGVDKILMYGNEGEAIIPTDKNKAYKDSISAIYDSSIPPSILNGFVNSYISNSTRANEIKKEHVIDYDKIAQAIAKNPQTRVEFSNKGIRQFVVKANSETEYLNERYSSK